MLKGALAPEDAGGRALRLSGASSSTRPKPRTAWHARGQRLQTGDDENQRPASWHSPLGGEGSRSFSRPPVIISALLKSWTWDVVEEICGFIASRHRAQILHPRGMAIDTPLGVGAHQDAKVVAPDLPLSILDSTSPDRAPFEFRPWLHRTGTPAACCRRLARITTVGPEYVLGDPARLWISALRQLATSPFHSKFAPHFTTGYGNTLRPLQPWKSALTPRSALPSRHEDPAICISRRNGIPTIVEARSFSRQCRSRVSRFCGTRPFGFQGSAQKSVFEGVVWTGQIKWRDLASSRSMSGRARVPGNEASCASPLQRWQSGKRV